MPAIEISQEHYDRLILDQASPERAETENCKKNSKLLVFLGV